MSWCPHCKDYYDEDNDTQPCCVDCGHPISCECGSGEYKRSDSSTYNSNFIEGLDDVFSEEEIEEFTKAVQENEKDDEPSD